MNSIHFPAYLQQHVISILGDIAMADVIAPDQRSAHVWELAPGCRLTQGSHDEVIVDPNTQNILTIVSADHNIATANGRWVVIPHGTPVRSSNGTTYSWVLHDVVARVFQHQIYPLDDAIPSISLFTGPLL